MPLEVELSYSAGTAAAAAAAGWFFYDYASQGGFESFVGLLLCVLVITGLEIFCLGLALHLLYRGIWLSSALFKGHDRRSRAALSELEGVAVSTFRSSFRSLYEIGLAVAFLTALWLTGHPAASLRISAVVAALLLALGFAAGPIGRRWPAALKLRERGARAMGLWWIQPPRAAPRRTSWRYRLVFWIGAPGLYFWNLLNTFSPVFTPSQEVYVQGEDSRVELYFQQRGLRGDGAAANWKIDSTVPSEIHFQPLSQARYVAVIETASLPPGVHRVRAQLRLQDGEGDASSSMEAGWAETSFLVVE